MRLLFSLLFLMVLLNACFPPIEDDLTEINMDLNSPEVQTIYQLQDKLETDSLIILLNHEDATQRYWAAKAFGSVQNEKAIKSLIPLLQDTVPAIQQIAAYALGQIASSESEEALVQAFDQGDSKNPLNRYILEAIGKSASASYLPLISTVQTYKNKDTFLLTGQAYCIYYYMLRGIQDKNGTARMLSLVQNPENLNNARLVAANYLFRGNNLGLDTLNIDTVLTTTFSRENDPRIRMALAIALGKTKTPLAKETLLAQYQTESDYRVKCNIIRSLANFGYLEIRDVVLAALRDPNLHIANTAVQFLTNSGYSREAYFYRNLSKDTTLHPQVQVGLLAASNAQMPNYFTDYKNRINGDLRLRFESETNPYLKAQALRSLGYYVRMYSYIIGLDLKEAEPVVQTAQLEALKLICEEETYAASLGISARRANKAIADYLLTAIKDGDVGRMAVAAGALRIPDRDFKTLLADSLSILESALTKLELPAALETYNELQQTIAHFKGEKPTPAIATFNHPINWNLAQKIGKESRAVIQTAKGNITLRFFPDLAPATTTNFVQLAQEGYFNGKNFHRVVPNFVIQGGCSRGDGYGGKNYSIRSELPPVTYERAGMVGMASAGKHTEGTQFFITHSPTLHLNGKYTIFAEVVDGMKVVHDIQVGDKITSVEVTQLKAQSLETQN